MGRLLIAVSILLAASIPAASGTIEVPREIGTIQGAIAASANGDVIVVKGGVYDEKLLIVGRSDLTIVGKKRATIRLTGSGAPISVSSCSRITISGLQIEGGDLAGIFIGNSTDVSVVRCRIRNAGAGVQVQAGERIRVEKSRIEDVTGAGIWLNGVNRSILEKNTISRCGGDAIAVRGEEITVDRNKAVDPGRNGLTVVGAKNVCTDNKLLRCGGEGIQIGRAGLSPAITTDNLISGNKVVGPRGHGCRSEGRANRFERNRLTRPGACGFLLGSDADRILDNKIQKPGEDGVRLVRGNGYHLEGNKVTGAGDNGFEIGTGGNTLIRNKASKSGTTDLLDSATPGTNDYEGNKFKTRSP